MPVAFELSQSTENQSLEDNLNHCHHFESCFEVSGFTRHKLGRSVRMISYSAAILSLQLSAAAVAQTPLESSVQSNQETTLPSNPKSITATVSDSQSQRSDQLNQPSRAEQDSLSTASLNPRQRQVAAVEGSAALNFGTQSGSAETSPPASTQPVGLTTEESSSSDAQALSLGEEITEQNPPDIASLSVTSAEDSDNQPQGIDPSLYLPELVDTADDQPTQTPVERDKPPFYKRLYNRFFGDEIGDVNYINVETKINQSEQAYSDLALELLASNVEEALIQVTEEDLMLGKSIFPRLRRLATEAAQAVGFYEAKFNFQIIDSNELFVIIDAGAPVLITQSSLTVGSAASDNKEIQKILDSEQLAVGQIFNHGFYSSTKASLIRALEDNGFFEKEPIQTDVEIVLPDNTADVNLRFDSGPRYEFGQISFVNTEGESYTQNDLPNQIEVSQKVLNQLVTFKPGEKFTQNQLDRFSSNLLNSKYFNGVDLQIIKPQSGSEDLTSTLIEPQTSAVPLPDSANQEEFSENQSIEPADSLTASQAPDPSSEKQTPSELSEEQSRDNQQLVDALNEPNGDLQLSDLDAYSNQLKRNLTPADLQRPVVVVLDSSNPNSAEVGLGFGTDTGVRARAQYNQNLLNSRGHSATANLEVSQVNQRIELGYRIPLSSPITDTLKFTVGYELENLSRRAKDLDVNTQTYVLGVNRDQLKNNWRHTPSVFYRLYELESQISQIDQDLLPDRFRASLADQSQEALLFGYRVERSDYLGGLTPYQGFKRYLSAEVGSENLLTDVNMAILRGGVAGLYSFGTLNDHQILARADAGAILTPSFQDVPYKLRFFAGGDRSIRGFDYQSLSPELGGFLYGGETLAVGSLEYNYRFRPKIRGALFADAGNAYEKNFNGDTELGVGFGVRYDSPVGPLRVDIAAGVSDEDLPIRLHFFIGPPL